VELAAAREGPLWIVSATAAAIEEFVHGSLLFSEESTNESHFCTGRSPAYVMLTFVAAGRILRANVVYVMALTGHPYVKLTSLVTVRRIPLSSQEGAFPPFTSV
jgi:hypothetical protein